MIIDIIVPSLPIGANFSFRLFFPSRITIFAYPLPLVFLYNAMPFSQGFDRLVEWHRLLKNLLYHWRTFLFSKTFFQFAEF